MKSILLGVFLIFSTMLHAASNQEVITWTKQTLLNSLSADLTSIEHMEQPPQGFTPNAWSAISHFLTNNIQSDSNPGIKLHPFFTQEPIIVKSGVTFGINYWRVNEEILFAEIHTKVAFSLVVLETKNSFLIQSMDMSKQQVNP